MKLYSSVPNIPAPIWNDSMRQNTTNINISKVIMNRHNILQDVSAIDREIERMSK